MPVKIGKKPAKTPAEPETAEIATLTPEEEESPPQTPTAPPEPLSKSYSHHTSDDWLPMDEAPQDGTVVHLCCVTGNTIRFHEASWDDGAWVVHGHLNTRLWNNVPVGWQRSLGVPSWLK